MTDQGISTCNVRITGIGSVSPFGPVRGLIGPRQSRLRIITDWPTNGARSAFLVEPFRPGDVVPGLKTRRLDRLSVWSLVACSLALQDACINLEAEDRSRFAVVFGTGFGCLDGTETYLRNVASYGYGKSDPIVFPETLSNSPASHVARVFGLRGPNVTLSCRGISGEAALLQAAALLTTGEASYAVVMAGDVLSRSLFEWYEAAGVLSSRSLNGTEGSSVESAQNDGIVPGEGLAAFVMEAGDACLSRGAPVYARFRSGCMGGDPQAPALSWGHDSRQMAELMLRAINPAQPSDVKLVIMNSNGSPSLDAMESEAIDKVFGHGGAVETIAPKRLHGELDGNAALRLTVALSHPGVLGHRLACTVAGEQEVEPGMSVPADSERLALMLGSSAGGGRATVTFLLP